MPDGAIDANDFFYFLERFADVDRDVADLTGSNDPNSSAYGVADGTINASDFFFYLMLFEAGCVLDRISTLHGSFVNHILKNPSGLGLRIPS